MSSHTGKTDSILFDNYDTGVLPPLGPFSSNTLADQVPVFQVFCFRGKTVDLLKVESFEMSRLNIRYVKVHSFHFIRYDIRTLGLRPRTMSHKEIMALIGLLYDLSNCKKHKLKW